MCMRPRSWNRSISRLVSTSQQQLMDFPIVIPWMLLGAVWYVVLLSNDNYCTKTGQSGYVQMCRLGAAVCAEALLGALQFVHSVHQGAVSSSYDQSVHRQPTRQLGSA